MDWGRALHRLSDPQWPQPHARAASRPSALSAASICIASGKGGTGKSVVAASIATLLAESGRTLLVDADLGVGNAHLLQDVHPPCTFVDLIQRRVSAEELVVPCRERLDLLAAGSGVSHMASLAIGDQQRIAKALAEIELGYEYVVIDSAAGISSQTIAFAAASDLVLLVTTPDVTAITDAYAFLKVLLSWRSATHPLLLVNRVAAPGEGESAATRLCEVAERFLHCPVRWVAELPDDRAVARAVAARAAVVLAEPAADVSLALRTVNGVLIDELRSTSRRGAGRRMLEVLGAPTD